MTSRTIRIFKLATMLSLAIFLFQFNVSYAQKDSGSKKKKIYVSYITAKKVSGDLADRLKNAIRLSIFENHGKTYQVLDDDTVKVIFKQSELIQITGGSGDRKMMKQLADGINADEIVYGEITERDGKIAIDVTNLERTGASMGAKSIVQIAFLESRLDHFAFEAGRKLMSPGYRIDLSKAPDEKENPELAGLRIEKIKIDSRSLDAFKHKGDGAGSLKAYGVGSLTPINFTTRDDTLVMIVDYLKGHISEGDELYKAGKYEKAKNKYLSVLERLNEKVSDDMKQRLNKLGVEESVVKRILNAFLMQLKTEVEEIDGSYKKDGTLSGDDAYNIAKKYKEVLEKNKLWIGKNNKNRVNQACMSLGKAIFKRMEMMLNVSFARYIEKADDKIRRISNPNLSDITNGIQSYYDVEGKMCMMKPYSPHSEDEWNNLMQKYLNMVNQRIRSVRKLADDQSSADALKIAAKGQRYFKEYKFLDAMKLYEDALSRLQENMYGLNENHATWKKLFADAKVIWTTARSYYINRINNLCDQANYYGIQDKKSKAKDKFRDAYDLYFAHSTILYPYDELSQKLQDLRRLLNDDNYYSSARMKVKLKGLNEYRIIFDERVLDRRSDVCIHDRRPSVKILCQYVFTNFWGHQVSSQNFKWSDCRDSIMERRIKEVEKKLNRK